MLVRMELSRIIVSELNDQPVVWLKECEGPRTIPIVIGLFEAASIKRHVVQEESPRPLTHDLLVLTISQLGGRLEDVVISRLEHHTYFAALRVSQGDKRLEIDARPSDAIALAVHSRPALPIWVDESVIEQTSNS